jgi:hypothetical membrane protein
MRHSAGVFFLAAGSIILMGIITGEIFYPAGYTTAHSFISTLGSTPPPNSIIYEPSARIFDTSMILGGIMILLGALGLAHSPRQKLSTIATFILGIGATGVGSFPAYHGAVHLFFAFLTFFGGGIAAVLFAREISAPFRYVSLLLGCLSLIFLFFGVLFPQLITPVFGIGGTERWIAYPIILWLAGFGGYLMGVAASK